MTLIKSKKYEHLKAMVGKKIGAQTKLNNYEYGRGKAKKIAQNRPKHINRAKDQVDLDLHDEGKGHKGNYK